MLKILQARLQQYMSQEFQYIQAGFRKVRETRDQIANLHWIIEKAKEFQKKKYLFLLHWLRQNFWLYGSQQTVELLKRWEYQTTLPASWETCMHVRLEPDMEQRTSSKLGQEYVKAVCCHPAYLTSVQSTSCIMPGWMKHKLESRLLGEIRINSDIPMTPPLCQKGKRN